MPITHRVAHANMDEEILTAGDWVRIHAELEALWRAIPTTPGGEVKPSLDARFWKAAFDNESRVAALHRNTVFKIGELLGLSLAVPEETLCHAVRHSVQDCLNRLHELERTVERVRGVFREAWPDADGKGVNSV